jgi:hypothetical protein
MGALETLQRRKLSVDDFHRMGEAGILSEDDRIGLIDGDVSTAASRGVISPLGLASVRLDLAELWRT